MQVTPTGRARSMRVHANKNVQTMTDEMLIRRAQAGDSSAVVTLYERYKQRIYQYLYYRLGEAYLAEDLTTEVFIRVIRGLPQLREANPSLQAWIFQIARNLATDHLRRARGRVHAALDERLVDPGPTPEHFAELSVTFDQLRDALHQLTEDQREVVLLRFINDLSIEQVVQIMNKSESAIKNLQLRGLRSLNRILSRHQVVYE